LHVHCDIVYGKEKFKLLKQKYKLKKNNLPL
jgi:hypothetical protein